MRVGLGNYYSQSISSKAESMKSRIDRQPYQQPDLDSIEELNYISTVEEDEVIDRHLYLAVCDAQTTKVYHCL